MVAAPGGITQPAARTATAIDRARRPGTRRRSDQAIDAGMPSGTNEARLGMRRGYHDGPRGRRRLNVSPCTAIENTTTT